MGRPGVLGHAQGASDIAGGQAFGLVAHEQPEGIKTGGLGQRGQRVGGNLRIDITRIMDEYAGDKELTRPLTRFSGKLNRLALH